MPNFVSFKKEDLIVGLDILYDAVAPSLGPRAYAAAIDEGFRRRVLDDGAEIARRIILEDKVQNFGANTVAQAARKTADEAGDSTTATIILAHAIIHESMKLVATGVHPMSLRKGLEDGIKSLVAEIDNIKRSLEDDEQQNRVAVVSCKDETLGKLISETITKMGVEGIVRAEESLQPETYVEFQEGMRFESGYANSNFITNPDTMEAVFLNPKILILDKPLSYEPFLPLFTEIQKQGLSLVIVAPEIDERMREFLVDNKKKGTLQSLYVNAPYSANVQRDFLQDLAVFTGAKYIALREGMRVEDISFANLGDCDQVVSNHNSSIIIGGKGDPEDIQRTIIGIKQLIKNTPSDFETEKLRERLAKLTSGVAIIKVGGTTDVEMLERKERVIDALAATRAAIEDGIVPGGETVYLRIKSALDSLEDTNARLVLQRAIEKPFEQLLSNSGLSVGEYKERLSHAKQGMGVDVTSGELVDMVKKGIVDPAKVVKCALQNAVSVAIQFLLINVIIAPGDQPIKK
jgi:chaperonin GroEL